MCEFVCVLEYITFYRIFLGPSFGAEGVGSCAVCESYIRKEMRMWSLLMISHLFSAELVSNYYLDL